MDFSAPISRHIQRHLAGYPPNWDIADYIFKNTAAKSNAAAVPFCTTYRGSLITPGRTMGSNAALVHL